MKRTLATLTATTLLLCASCATLADPDPAAKPAPPRAVVVVVIDQMRYDYYEKYRDYFGEGGFKRFEREGQMSLDCRYEYAHTVTAAGHATLLTGVNPSVHGIVGNAIYDRAAGHTVSNCEDSRTHTIADAGPTDATGDSPHLLLHDTVGDRLEKATSGAAKTLSISLKDRAAIMMGGHNPDGAFWFDGNTGRFITSSYYMSALPDWLLKFNASGAQDRWVGKQWDLALPATAYAARGGSDDQAGERKSGLGNLMPKQLPAKADQKYYYALEGTPYADELVVDAAIAGVEATGIGADDTPDLLTISLSAFDLAGHAYGPDSWEMMDFTIREDRNVARLLDFLDKQIGEGKYTLLLSADHGITPLPEVTKSKGHDAVRINGEELQAAAEAAMEKHFGPLEGKAYVREFSEPYLVLNPTLTKPSPDAVAAELRGWLLRQTDYAIGAAFTRLELMAVAGPNDDRLLTAARASFHPDRSGDVFVVSKPNSFFAKSAHGTTHGAPYEPDQRVPMMAIGAGFGKFAIGGPSGHELPEAKSTLWLARSAASSLGLSPDH